MVEIGRNSIFRFLKLGGEEGHLTRDDLRSCGLESNPLGDRLIGIRSLALQAYLNPLIELLQAYSCWSVRKNPIKDMFIPPQSADADMNMNTETCSFHQFCMVLAHFQPSTSKTQETDINSRNEVIYGHKGHLRSFQVMSSFMAIQN